MPATTILNLTQHIATEDQVAAGVVDLPEPRRAHLKSLLTFIETPSAEVVIERAQAIAAIAVECSPRYPLCAMIAGAPYLMSTLESELIAVGVSPVYAFSARESVEKADQEGNVTKVTVFRHKGFVPAAPLKRDASPSNAGELPVALWVLDADPEDGHGQAGIVFSRTNPGTSRRQAHCLGVYATTQEGKTVLNPVQRE